MYALLGKSKVYFWQEFPSFFNTKNNWKIKQTPFKMTCAIFKNKPILIPLCFINELQKQLSKNTFLYAHNIVFKQGRVIFSGFSTKAHCPLFCLKSKVTCGNRSNYSSTNLYGPGAMPCNNNNVFIKENSNWIIHRRKKHLKIFILLQSYWQMCVGDAAEILAHSDE